MARGVSAILNTERSEAAKILTFQVKWSSPLSDRILRPVAFSFLSSLDFKGLSANWLPERRRGFAAHAPSIVLGFLDVGKAGGFFVTYSSLVISFFLTGKGKDKILRGKWMLPSNSPSKSTLQAPRGMPRKILEHRGEILRSQQ